ncbi:DUF6092 family protein [Pseudonocardia acaciae]|uniref:DUF6092 family protein n=1 Tax=Pseudonocardia acaciae TaxID=551276 RepID=UPI00048ECCD3|nr:DUF6092 family protein [Pseudonocardia acaciae]
MPENLDRELFKIITYLVNSAPLSLEETPQLSAFRLADAANRLMALVDDDEFLRAAGDDFRAHFNLVMTDQPAFEAWLADNAGRFTLETRRRELGT